MAKDDGVLSLIGHIASLIGTAVGGAAAFAGAIMARNLMKPAVVPQGSATIPVAPSIAADVAVAEQTFAETMERSIAAGNTHPDQFSAFDQLEAPNNLGVSHLTPDHEIWLSPQSLQRTPPNTRNGSPT